MAEASTSSGSGNHATRISVEELLHCLVECSEKAACIARAFRAQKELFEILVEEKSEIKKNREKTVQDFKTLADVLIQETIKRDVGRMFPILSDKVEGEEQNSFKNSLGESIKVQLTDSVQDTTDLLCKVLNGQVAIAESIAEIVHSDVTVPKEYTSHHTIKAGRLGIWIDPIDSTTEYIQAKESRVDEHGIDLCGLKCVCVLIGVYDMKFGAPVIGVINQPFYTETDNASKWKSNIYWGIRIGPLKATSVSLYSRPTVRRKIIVRSYFEDKQLLSLLETRYTVVNAAGAGYKCLAVAKHSADLYVLTLPSTHFWDTCGPHAILAALGGGISDFVTIMEDEEDTFINDSTSTELQYLKPPDNKSCKNTRGVIAYKYQHDLTEFSNFLREHNYHTIYYKDCRLKN